MAPQAFSLKALGEPHAQRLQGMPPLWSWAEGTPSGTCLRTGSFARERVAGGGGKGELAGQNRSGCEKNGHPGGSLPGTASPPPPHADTAGVAHQAESGLRGRGCRFAVSFPTQGSLAWSASSAEAFLFRWTPGSGERGRGSKKVFHNEGVSCLKSVPFQLSKLFWSERPRSLGLQASLRDTGKGESCSLPPPPRR